MASYCDEFSFDEVFEDPSYVQVSVSVSNKQTRQVKSYSLLQDEDNKEDKEKEEEKEKENDENEDPDYEKIKDSKELELFEMGLHELEFMKDSMTEEELDHFWKEMSANKYKTNRSKVYPIYDVDVDVEEKEEECEFYFQREIMAI
jgi:hypothetical protein